MSPASKLDELEIVKCSVKIEHLEETIKELKQELRNQRRQKIETQRQITNTRLAIYLTIASVIGGIMVTIFEKIIELVV